MKKGFTLLELIVVIIIIGILASLGFVQYAKMIEKGRTAEAKTDLGVLRTQELVYYQEKGVYASVANIGIGLPEVAPACTNTNYYFGYSCVVASGTCTATRCTGGGKPPDVAAAGAYIITLDVNGTWSGTAGYY